MNWWHYWMMTNPACTVTRGCTASTIQCCQAIDLNLQLSDIGLLGAFILGSRFCSYHVLRSYSRARASHFLKVTPHAVIFSAIILRMLTIKSLSHRANIVPRSLCHTYLPFLLAFEIRRPLLCWCFLFAGLRPCALLVERCCWFIDMDSITIVGPVGANNHRHIANNKIFVARRRRHCAFIYYVVRCDSTTPKAYHF